MELSISPGNYRDSANWSELFRVGNEFGILAVLALDKFDSALVMSETRFWWSESFRSRHFHIPDPGGSTNLLAASEQCSEFKPLNFLKRANLAFDVLFYHARGCLTCSTICY